VGVIFLTHTVDAVVPRRFATRNTILLECGNLDLYSARMQLDTLGHTRTLPVSVKSRTPSFVGLYWNVVKWKKS